MGFDAQPEQGRVAVERLPERGEAKLSQLGLGEDGIAHQPRLAALADQLDRIAQRDHCEHFDGLGQ